MLRQPGCKRHSNTLTACCGTLKDSFLAGGSGEFNEDDGNGQAEEGGRPRAGQYAYNPHHNPAQPQVRAP